MVAQVESGREEVGEEPEQAVGAVTYPPGEALLHVVSEHQRVPFAVGRRGLGHAVPARAQLDRKGVAGRRTEAELLGALGRFALRTFMEDGPQMRLGVVARQVDLAGE